MAPRPAPRPGARARFLPLLLCAAVALARRAPAQNSLSAADAAAPAMAGGTSCTVDAARPPVTPFPPGERLTYDVKFGPIHVGHGSMELVRGDTLRGREAYHAMMRINGGTLFFKVRDRIESWFDARTLISLRFTQLIHEGGYHAERKYEIYPDRAAFAKAGKPESASVTQPLDDVSFLYFLRTLRLEVGSEFACDRYFQPTGNPVVIKVLRREMIEVPAGKFDAVVVRPLIRTKGMFSQDGDAQVWLNAGGAHEVLQLKTHLAFGSLNLYLTGIDTTVAPGSMAADTTSSATR